MPSGSRSSISAASSTPAAPVVGSTLHKPANRPGSVVVSESNGTVRLFQHGQIVLRIEPFQRAMKWVDFDYEPPVKEEA